MKVNHNPRKKIKNAKKLENLAELNDTNIQNNNSNDQNQNDNNNDNENDDANEKGDRTIGEKVEDGLDAVFDGAARAIYGDPGLNNIPATIENSQEKRVYYGYATRRNIIRKYFMNKKFAKIFLGFFGFGILGIIITFIIKAILLA